MADLSASRIKTRAADGAGNQAQVALLTTRFRMYVVRF